MANNRSQLEQLPLEIASEGVAPYLDGKDITNVRLASKTMNALFAPASRAEKLLHFVRESNYEKAKELVEADPRLMFQYISYKKDEGSNGTISPLSNETISLLSFAIKNFDTYVWEPFLGKIIGGNNVKTISPLRYETISPLRFAFKNFDTYMWKMFLEKIIGCNNVHILKAFPSDLEKYKNSHILVSEQLYSVNADGKAEIANIKNLELFRRFVKQLEEQKDHINLEPFFAAYETFVNQFNRWLQDKINQNLIRAWLNVGKMQRDVLPRHMLKEFCRRSTWSEWSESKFDVASNPWPPLGTTIYNYSTDRHESVHPLVRLGVDFAYARGKFSCCCAVVCCRVSVEWITCPPEFRVAEDAMRDSAAFRRLFEERTRDLVTLCAQLNLSSENTHKM